MKTTLTETKRRLWLTGLCLDTYFAIAIRLPTAVHERECKQGLLMVSKMVNDERHGKGPSSTDLAFFYELPKDSVWEFQPRHVLAIPSGLELMESLAHTVELASLCRSVIAVTRNDSIETQQSIPDFPTLACVLETVSFSITRQRVHQAFLKWFDALESNFKPFPSLEYFLTPTIPEVVCNQYSNPPPFVYNPTVSIL